MKIKLLSIILMLLLGVGYINKIEVINANNVSVVDDASVNNVINMIDNLPLSCTLKDEQDVRKCRQAYDALTSNQKVNVTNLFVLLEKESQIAALYNEVSNVVALIDTLPDVNEFELDNENDLKQILNAYNSLDNLQKELVNNYSKLVALTSRLESIYKSINELIILIDSLPSVDLIDINIYVLISKINDIYNTLSDVQKSKITNLNKYQSIINVLNQIDTLINSINNIPSILTNEDYEIINNIQESYLSLTKSQRTLVTNYTEFYTLYLSVLDAKEFNDLIDEIILSIDLDNKYLLDYLLNKYEEYSTNQKVFITNYEKLLILKDELILEEQYYNHALEVSLLIDELPLTLTLTDKELVNSVRIKYDNLENESKKYVTNYHLLLSAESEIIKLENQKQSEEINNLTNEINNTKEYIENLKKDVESQNEESQKLIDDINKFIEETKRNEAKGLNKYIIIAIGLTAVFIVVAIVYIFSLNHSKINIVKEEF